jgi:NTP pyrophosphatase (non-canonical NTP hydrolase)
VNLNEYQDEAGKTNKGTALYVVEKGTGVLRPIAGMYNALGMNGEAGEVAEKIKKLARDGRPSDEAAFRAGVCKELGDVLWYLAACARDFGFTLEEVATANLDKLASRKARNVLSGSGDDR